MRPMPELTVYTLPVADLVPYANNAKKHPEKQVDEIATSIDTFGNCDPIAVWHNENGEPEIVEGHGRLLALKKLGIKTAPVIYLDHLTDEQRRAYTHVHNQTTLSSGFDYHVLAEDIDTINADWASLGFDAFLNHDMTDDWFNRTDKDGDNTEGEDDEYADFVEKFKPKKTTDDCYTPEPVYEAVASWVETEYGKDRATFVRPFYPNGDYVKERYPEGCVVVDNPPFSILSEILRFYTSKGIDFFLFAPTLTLFSGRGLDLCYLPVDAAVRYENGANVSTSFITNLDRMRIHSIPRLYKAIKEANDKVLAETSTDLPKYSFPDQVVTAARASYYAKHDTEFAVAPEDCARITGLDAMGDSGKAIFGGGFLLSEKAAAEKAAATRWQLSEREWQIVRSLG